MCTINPKIDIAFKKLFGSEENKDILMSLINAVIYPEPELKEITLKNPYNLADYLQGKNSILDIRAEDEKARIFDIEMQVGIQDYYGKRALYYWGKVYSDQIQAGGQYGDLKATIGIHFLDFPYFPDEKRYHRRCMIKDYETNEMYDQLRHLDMYFIEMSKFTKEMAKVKEMLAKWVYFLNFAYEMSKGKVPVYLAKDQMLAKAVEKLDIMYMEKEERMMYESQQKALRDRHEEIRTAEVKGREEGIAIGEARGKVEGIEALLEVKFGEEGLSLMEKIRQIQDVARLTQIQNLVKTAKSLAEVQEQIGVEEKKA